MTEERTLPAGFAERMEAELGTETASRVLAALRGSAPARAAVRINRRKGAVPGADLCGEPVPWSGGEGFYIKGERPVFAYDPAWHAGLYYVQDASSMAISAAVAEVSAEAESPLRYLDMCAAPGGKTIAAIDALPEGSTVVANEFDRRRAGILVENLEKWGYPDVAASCGDTSAFRELPGMFDIVAVDAPCSGEGMMRKEAEAIAQWSPGLVSDCAALQREILGNAVEALRPGGFLIYSTCTFNREENEDNVAWAISEFGLEITELKTLAGTPGVVSLEPGCYRFMPGYVEGEGLFLCVLRNPEDAPTGEVKFVSKSKLARSGRTRHGASLQVSKGSKQGDFKNSLTKGITTQPHVREMAKACLGEGFAPIAADKAGTAFSAIPIDKKEFYAALGSALDLRMCGTAIGSVKGRDIAPAHSLALSTSVRPEAFPRVELADIRQTISYLRGEGLGDLGEGVPKGAVIVTFGGAPLGFVKNLGKRANNLFPQHLRLKTVPAAGYQAPELVRLSHNPV